MQVNKTIQTPEGTVQFQGELTQAELDMVLTIGLSMLLYQGAIKSIKPNDELPN
jgi:hypothetical protein